MTGALTLRAVLALLLLAGLAVLAALNWTALAALSTWQLGFAEVQLPVGVALLLLTTPLFLIYLIQHIAGVIETRRLLRHVQRLQKLADQAEDSRIEALRELIAREFGRLNTRLDALTMPNDGQSPPAFGLAEATPPATPTAATRVAGVSRWFRSGP